MGSFPIDIDLKMDPSSLLKAYKQMTDAIAKLTKQAGGDILKVSKEIADVQETYVRQIATLSSRQMKQQESAIRALERQAEVYKKDTIDVLRIKHEKWIKTLGDDEKAIKRVTAAFDQMIKKEEEEDRKRKLGHGGASPGILMLRGARDIFEGRMAYGTMDIGRAAFNLFRSSGGAAAGAGEAAVAGAAGGAAGAAVKSGALGGMFAGISGTALALGGTAVAFAGIEMASYKAAEAIGEYGRHLKEIQNISGMSAREVQQFEYAAKLTGKNVEDILPIMRNLTQQMDNTGQAGKKARAALQSMGVDFIGFRAGTISTYEALKEMGEALRKQPDFFKNNAEAADILKRAGIGDENMLRDLKKAMDDTKDMHLFDQKDMDRMNELDEKIKLFHAHLENTWKHIQLMASTPIEFTINVGGTIFDFLSHLPTHDLFKPKAPDYGVVGPPHLADTIAPGQFAAFQRQMGGSGLDAAERELADAKKEFDQTLEATSTNLLEWSKDPIGYRKKAQAQQADVERQEADIKARRKFQTDTENISNELLRVREQVKDQLANMFELPAEAQKRKFEEQLQAMAPAIQRGANAKAIEDLLDQLIGGQRTDRSEKIQRTMQEMLQAQDREDAKVRATAIQQVQVRELGRFGPMGEEITRTDVEDDINRRYKQRIDLARQEQMEQIQDIANRVVAEGDIVNIMKKGQDIIAANRAEKRAEDAAEIERQKALNDLKDKERELEHQHIVAMSKLRLADQEDQIKHDADLARKRAELRFKGDSPAAGIAEDYRIAVDEAQKLFDLEMERIKQFEVGKQKEYDTQLAINKLHKEDAQAREEAELRIAEMQQKQLDELKQKIEPLYETLFTHPGQFGQQLRGTLQAAALHPIVSGLSEMTSRALYPLIYGATGTGGISGIFGGMFGGGRLNDVHLINGSVPVHVTNIGGGGGGGAGTSIYSTGGYSGGGFTPAPWAAGVGGFSPAPWAIGPGGTAGFTGPVDIGDGGGPSPWGIATPPFVGGGGGPWGGIFGGGTASGGGWAGFARGILGLGGAIKQAFTRQAVPGETPGAESLARAFGGLPFGQKLGTILSSKAAAGLEISAGMPLAMAGITGTARGTGTGIIESLAGGALTGAGIGTMILPGLGTAIGAGIGAVAGLGIGLGEMIAGVESPRNQAKRLATGLYHIAINNSTADAIVQVANQNYGGQVSVAVRSPEVRHMLGLYAAGTGQSRLFPVGADPHGASLVESGGMLQQQATYQYGQAYAYQSNLPIYGGGSPINLGSPASSPGGNLSLSLNVGGDSAAKFFQGHVVTPDVIQTQYNYAMMGSAGRVQQALTYSQPGSLAV